MSILNVNRIQPVGSGQTVTINAANISAGSATLTAGTFSGTFSGNLSGNVNSTSGITTVTRLNVGTSGTVITTTSGGLIGIGTLMPQTTLDVGGTIRNTPDKSSYIQVGRFSAAYGGAALSTAGGATFLSLQVEGFEAAKIDSAGRMTRPYQPAFSAYASSIGNPGTTAVKIPYVESIDYGGNFTNSEFTCPVAGLYHFYARHWYTAGTTGTAFLFFYRNGAVWKEARVSLPTAPPDYFSIQLITNSYLSANDIISVYAVSSSAAGQFHASNGTQYSEFSGYLIA